MSAFRAPEIVQKHPTEVRTLVFSWAQSDAMADEETISSSAVAVVSGDLTVDSYSESGKEVQVNVSGGSAGVHIVRVTATTSESQVLVGEGKVIVST